MVLEIFSEINDQSCRYKNCSQIKESNTHHSKTNLFKYLILQDKFFLYIFDSKCNEKYIGFIIVRAVFSHLWITFLLDILFQTKNDRRAFLLYSESSSIRSFFIFHVVSQIIGDKREYLCNLCYLIVIQLVIIIVV